VRARKVLEPYFTILFYFDLITLLHNSNKPTAQTTISGEIILEEKYFLLGFIKGKDLQIEENIWFTKLNSRQLSLLTDCLKEKCYF
jgi:hypothetical protein